MCSSTGPKIFGPPQGLQTSGSFQAPVTYAGSAQPTANVGTPPPAPPPAAPAGPTSTMNGTAQPTTGAPISQTNNPVMPGGAGAAPSSDMAKLTNNPFQYAGGGRMRGNPIFRIGRGAA